MKIDFSKTCQAQACVKSSLQLHIGGPWATRFLVLVKVRVPQNRVTQVKLFDLSIAIFLELRDLKIVLFEDFIV